MLILEQICTFIVFSLTWQKGAYYNHGIQLPQHPKECNKEGHLEISTKFLNNKAGANS